MTSITMRQLTILFTSIIVLFLFTGCDENHSSEEPRSPVSIGGHIGENSLEASYQLPSGWEFKPDEPLKARLFDQSQKPLVPPDTVLEMSAEKKGTEEEAKALAQEYYTQQQADPQNFILNMIETELGGEKIYAVEAQTDSYWGQLYWYTTAYFEKDGTVMSFVLDDRIENQKEALETAIKTLIWK